MSFRQSTVARLTAIEQHLIDRVKDGSEADMGTPQGGDGSDSLGSVRAEVLWAVCAGARAEWTVGERLYVSGARVTGRLDLSGLHLERPIRFSRCAFTDTVDLTDARVDHPIEFLDCRTSSLLADRMESQADLVLRRVRLHGALSLREAELARDLRCTGTEIKPIAGVAFDGSSMLVKGAVFLDEGFQADGETRLASAHIYGNLDLRGARLRNPPRNASGGTSLQARRLVLDGDLLCDENFASEGEICVQRAQLRSFRAGGATFSNPGGLSLRADAVHCLAGLYLDRDFHSKGQVRLVGAEIDGELCCTGGTFENPAGTAVNATRVHADDAYLDAGFVAHGEVRLTGGKLERQLCCSSGSFDNAGGYALDADGLICDGDVFLNDKFHANGSVRLIGATVKRELNCTGGTFDNQDGKALEADGITVQGNLYLDGKFRARGEVRLFHCVIGEQLMCSGGVFDNPGGRALDISGGVVRGDVLLDNGFRAVGPVRMLGTSIDKNLDVESGELLGTTHALDAFGLHVGGRMVWLPATTPAGGVDLSHASVDRLKDRPESWPDKGVRLTGFTYRTLEEAMTVEQRLAWLNRTEEYAPDSYQQLAAAYRASGQGDAAREAAIAEERARRERGKMSKGARLWNWLLDYSVGYGYSLHRPFIAVIVLGLVNTIFYRMAAHNGIMEPVSRGGVSGMCPDNYPCFIPYAYSFETLLPVVNLRQAGYWLPRADSSWGLTLLIYTWFCILLGWVLGIAFGAGLGRVFKRG